MRGINVTIIGQGAEFSGVGSKYLAAVPVLKDLPDDSLVVLSDSRDIITNIHQAKSHSQNLELYSALSHFRDTFSELTSNAKSSVVVSAEAQCCGSALHNIEPGDLFSKDLKRTGRACSLKKPSCVLKDLNTEGKPWDDFMKKSAQKRGMTDLADVYLNAGLLAAKAKDLLKFIKTLDIRKEEDDQAVLTALMYRNPDSIVLDYEQSMFGNNRWALGDEKGCVFDALPKQDDDDEKSPQAKRLVHLETGKSPLFIHSPGQFTKCHLGLLDKLQLRPTKRAL